MLATERCVRGGRRGGDAIALCFKLAFEFLSTDVSHYASYVCYSQSYDMHLHTSALCLSMLFMCLV